MTRYPLWLLTLLAWPLLVAGLPAPAAFAATPDGAEGSGYFRCDRDFESRSARARSSASVDLYNGLLYFGGAGALALGGSATRRWSRVNGFDAGLRDGLRLDTAGQRERADTASDVLLGVSAAAMPALAIARQFDRTHDCVETWDMFTDMVESLSLTIFLTESIKLATGRARPFTRECDVNAPSDASCDGRDRYKSFVSGHSSLAAAGAGLSCAFSIKREAWGTSTMARAAPCTLGVAAAIAVGALRMTADRHWGSDVLVGFGLGAAIGYFDTWGPFDWLKFETRDAKGRVSSRGMVVPQAFGDRFGARLVMAF